MNENNASTPATGQADEPRIRHVTCASPVGLHRMAYAEWGDQDNPDVLLCVHGLTRLGRDFDRLARAMRDRYRVVCPDVVGRGASDRLKNPAYYAIPQYVADMVTLIARLDVERVDWVGTSMGGLIGIGLAGQTGSPIRQLVLNDVGPTLGPEAIARIGTYVGQPISFASIDEATQYQSVVAAPFGLKTMDEWRELVTPALRLDGGRYVFRYDPSIAVPFRAVTPRIGCSRRGRDLATVRPHHRADAAGAGCRIRSVVAGDRSRDVTARAPTGCGRNSRRRARADINAGRADLGGKRVPTQ